MPLLTNLFSIATNLVTRLTLLLIVELASGFHNFSPKALPLIQSLFYYVASVLVSLHNVATPPMTYPAN